MASRTERDRYSIARLIGRVLHQEEQPQPPVYHAARPGRWGTTTPSLGVPVSFAEINNISVLCEIVAMRDDLIPDVSLGNALLQRTGGNGHPLHRYLSTSKRQ
jgi:hypothetical protein